MATPIRSYAKINLGLAIGSVRPDGFHDLLTLYQTVDLFDVVTVSARRAASTRILLTTNHPSVPRDARNTAWRMVVGALEHLDLSAVVEIHIEKRLPVQGGMGAGSANAAAALIALERDLDTALPAATRLALATQIGSDVPLFLVGGTVLGQGRGELVSAMPDLPKTHCVIAIPEMGISTPQAFRDWDLTSGANRDTVRELSRAYASVFPEAESETSGIVRHLVAPMEANWTHLEQSQGDIANGLAENTLLALVRTGIENDFEEVVFSHHPSMRDIKRQLLGRQSDAPALYAALSGSGSALFGLYRSIADARAAQHRAQAFSVRVLLTETLPRSEYWRKMFAESPPRK